MNLPPEVTKVLTMYSSFVCWLCLQIWFCKLTRNYSCLTSVRKKNYNSFNSTSWRKQKKEILDKYHRRSLIYREKKSKFTTSTQNQRNRLLNSWLNSPSFVYDPCSIHEVGTQKQKHNAEQQKYFLTIIRKPDSLFMSQACVRSSQTKTSGCLRVSWRASGSGREGF